MRHQHLLIAFSLAATACSATKRSQAMYRQDTHRALETRNAQIKTCYDEALETDPKIAGLVTLRFVVKRKTGAFANATIDPTKSNASEPLMLCVLNAVRGLKLTPPDANEGRATFVYEFQPTTPPT